MGRIDIRTTFPNILTSPVNLQSDENRFINLNVVLLKRIRIVGGVQNLIAETSLLTILNGKAALVFGFQAGDITDNKSKDDFEQKKLINTNNDFCSCSTPVYNNSQQIDTIYPYHFEVNEVRNVQDFLIGTIYSTITAVKTSQQTEPWFTTNASDTNTSLLQNEMIQIPFPKTNASSDKSVMASPAVQALDLQMKLLSFIVTPSPITSLSMNEVYGHQFNYIYDSTQKQTYQLPRQTIPLQSIMRVRYMLHPYYFGKQWIMRVAIAYAPCGIVVLDIRVQVKFSISVETEIKNLKRYCIFKPNNYHNYIKGEKYGNKKPLLNYIAIVEMLKKSTQHSITSVSQCLLGTEAGSNNIQQMEIKLKPPSLVPLLIASQKLTKMMQTLLDAGKILTQDEEELVFSHYAKQSNTSSLDEPILLFHTPGCFQTLIARGYAPSLLTSMQILDKNNIAVVADH
ncbi:MAG: hypothetical protein EZS28_002536, partial [Streblomastix strix]